MKQLSLFLILQLFGVISNAQITTFDIDTANLNKPLMVILDSLYHRDQTPRYEYLDAIHNNESVKKIDSLHDIVRKNDKENLLIVDSILKQHGWLGPQKVGINGSQALFLVIQHADLITQQNYLPMIRIAEKKGEILSSNLAILEDRINMKKHTKQIYGSQSIIDKQTGKIYIYPIIDPDRLDERRKSMGLSPMKVYVKDWDLEDYKKELPNIERLAKQLNIN
ncbi:MAG: hypothetical protein JWQ06_728 [Mucilaginibacter sp.]|nr:hypothetical protein [Mucilaginibacter sp.]